LTPQNSLFVGPLVFALALGILAAAFPVPVPAGDPPAGPVSPTQLGRTDQENLARTIVDLLRQERRDEALALCRTYVARYPDDSDMLYNLACLENMTGHPEQALATFSAAVAAGFDDFDLAFSDPDLDSLKFHPGMVDLSLAHQLRLSDLAAARTVNLSWQTPSPPLPLTAGYDQPGNTDPTLRLTWTPVGLDLVLAAGASWSGLAAPNILAPWNGGPGLVFTLGISEADRPNDYRAANNFLFAFGLEKGAPAGATFLTDQNRWQVIAELQPKIRLDAQGHLEMRTTVPWDAILPYNPLVDERLGVNAALRLTGPDAPTPASLLPDPAAFRPQAASRRVVPLIFGIESIGEEIFVGKVSHSLSDSLPVTLDLAAVSTATGTGQLTLDFLEGPGQSLLPEGQVAEAVELTKGPNRLTRQADFSALDTGAYVIQAALSFPSGRTLSWGTTVLQLAPGWQEDYRRRIDHLEPQEKPTALYHLDTIIAAVAAHHPRRGPGALVTALGELDKLLDNAAAGGSILPDQGSFLAVYAGPGGDPRLCHLYLPARWRAAAKLNPVLTITPATGMAGALADRMGRNYELGARKPTLKTVDEVGFPVYLVPRLAAAGARGPWDMQTEIEACLDWARQSFSAATVSLVGVSQGAGAVLGLAAGKAGALNALLIYAGKDLEPWPQADLGYIQQELANFPPHLPLTWIDFVDETALAGQGRQILQALEKLGSNIVDTQEVRGPLNFTQVADRTVLWAEDLR
jgi:hypothetical protein